METFIGILSTVIPKEEELLNLPHNVTVKERDVTPFVDCEIKIISPQNFLHSLRAFEVKPSTKAPRGSRGPAF